MSTTKEKKEKATPTYEGYALSRLFAIASDGPKGYQGLKEQKGQQQ